MSNTGKLVVFSGFSGSGKGTYHEGAYGKAW